MPTLKQLLYQNKKLSYVTLGEGAAILLLHGFGEGGEIWKNQFYSFPNHKLIIPDLPGSGSSEMINDMSMEGLAAAVKVIVDTETNEKIIIIGHSMGGYITLAFAQKYPQLILGFGLFHSSAYADSEEKISTRQKGIEFIKNNDAYSFLKTSIPNLYAPATKEQQPEVIEQHIGHSKLFDNAALISYYHSMIERPDRTTILKETSLPVLFVLGRHDTAVPVEDGLKQCHLTPVSYIHILENSGHMGMIEERESANTVLKEFVSFVNDHHP